MATSYSRPPLTASTSTLSSSSTSAAAAKLLSSAPSFPLSPVDLARWNRFARKGGIGTAMARKDKVSEEQGRDLMFLEGDEVVVLMDLGGAEYLGFCEGVVGLFNGFEVSMNQAKLKRPVISSRPSSSSASSATTAAPLLPCSTSTAKASSSSSSSKTPASPSRHLPRSITSIDVRPTSSATSSAPPAAEQPRRLSRSTSFDQSLATAGAQQQQKPLPSIRPSARRKPVPEVEVLAERFDAVPLPQETAAAVKGRRKAGGGNVKGLGIDVESATESRGGGGFGRTESVDEGGGGRVGRTRSASESSAGEAQETLSTSTSSRSPALAGAFSPLHNAHPYHPSSRRSSSSHGNRPAAASPAPSSASSSTGASTTSMRTPSLMTSPFSPFTDHGDADSASSASEDVEYGVGPRGGKRAGMGMAMGMGLGRLGPVTPPAPMGAFDPVLSYDDVEGGEEFDEDYRDGPTPTSSKFPLPSSSYAAAKHPPRPHPHHFPVAPASSPVVPAPPTPPTKDFRPSLLGNLPSSSSSLRIERPHGSFSSVASTSSSFSSSVPPQPGSAPPLRSQFSRDTFSSLSSAASPPPPGSAPLPPLAADDGALHPFSRPSSFLPGAPPGLSAGGLPLSSISPAHGPRSAFSSFTPDSSLASSSFLEQDPHPPYRGEVEEDEGGERQGEGTEEDDPTLAFIFDSYRYDSGKSSRAASLYSAGGVGQREGTLSRSTSTSGGVTPVAAPVEQEYVDEEEEEEEEEEGEAVAALSRRPSAFGAASQLRSRLQLEPSPPLSTAADTLLTPSYPSSPSLADLKIPRMSSIFPRSGTQDSFASGFGFEVPGTPTSDRGEDGEGYGYGMRARMRQPESKQQEEEEREKEEAVQDTPKRRTTSLPPSSPSPSPARSPSLPSSFSRPPPASPSSSSSPPAARIPRTRTESVPVLPVSSDELSSDLDASRRLFQAHFARPPSALVSAAEAAGVSLALPGRKGEVKVDEGRRDKRRTQQVRGLQISAPLDLGMGMGGVGAGGRWRSAGGSPVKQALPRMVAEEEQEQEEGERGDDVFVASPASVEHPLQVEVVDEEARRGQKHPYAAGRYGQQEDYQPYAVPSSYPHPHAPHQHHQHHQHSNHPYISSPSSFASSSQQTFASAPSSPFVSASDEGFAASSSSAFSFPSSTSSPPPSSSFASSAFPDRTNEPRKLRKLSSAAAKREKEQQHASLRAMKSSPSLGSFASLGSVATGSGSGMDRSATGGGSDEGVTPPATTSGGGRSLSHSKSSTGLFSRARRAESASSSPVLERGGGAFGLGPASTTMDRGISNRDFEEETVQIGGRKGGAEFEMVKPLAVLLNGSSSAEGEEGRASTDSAGTPERPCALPESFPLTTPSSTSLSASTRPSTSLSHFSPVTPSSVESPSTNPSSLADHRAKEQKWLTVLSSRGAEGGWDVEKAKKSKKVRLLVWSGVPSSVRGKVWAFLAGGGGGEGGEGMYQALSSASLHHLSPLPAQLVDQIERDVDCNLLVDLPQFAPGSAGRDDLMSVLFAFARSSPSHPYTPSLPSLAALLLTQMPASDAFTTLTSLVRNYSFKMFFPAGKEELRLECLMFEVLLEAAEGKVAKRLRDLSIPASSYLPALLSSFFLSVLPLPSVLRLTDLLLFDRLTLYRAPLALLSLLSSSLLDTSECPTRDAVLNLLMAPPREVTVPGLLVPATVGVKGVTEEKVRKAQKKAAERMLKATKKPVPLPLPLSSLR
ncbi:hypothetical protein JCM8547_004244 [Rhodosporidiobolus lusitaniae]